MIGYIFQSILLFVLSNLFTISPNLAPQLVTPA